MTPWSKYFWASAEPVLIGMWWLPRLSNSGALASAAWAAGRSASFEHEASSVDATTTAMLCKRIGCSWVGGDRFPRWQPFDVTCFAAAGFLLHDDGDTRTVAQKGVGRR